MAPGSPRPHPPPGGGVGGGKGRPQRHGSGRRDREGDISGGTGRDAATLPHGRRKASVLPPPYLYVSYCFKQSDSTPTVRAEAAARVV